jgi:hypothetical protein
MGLWKARIDNLDCGWSSPVPGPVHPAFVPVEESSGIGWLEGFDELLVRCGLRSFGAPDFDSAGMLKFPLHGRVANLPAQKVALELDAEHSLLHVTGVVRECRFLQYSLSLQARYTFAWGEPSIDVHDKVTNASGTPSEMQLLYHINIGEPLLAAGATMHLSAPRVVARNKHAASNLNNWQNYLEPTPGFSEQVYFTASQAGEDGWARSLLAAPDQSSGFAVHYQIDTLPYFTQWKNTVAEQDGYVTGLEPGTGFPNPRTFEQAKGRLVQLQPGESRDFRLKLEATRSAERVAQLKSEIERSRNGVAELSRFDPDWCVGES